MYKARERQAAYCALLLQRRRPEGPELAIVKSAPTRGQHSRARERESTRPHCLSRAEPRFPSTEEDDGDAGGGGGKKKTRARAILPAGKSEREREGYNFVLQCVWEREKEARCSRDDQARALISLCSRDSRQRCKLARGGASMYIHVCACVWANAHTSDLFLSRCSLQARLLEKAAHRGL